MADSVVVTDIEPPLELELPDDGDIVLLPEDLDDERGVYPITAAGFADDLTEVDLTVRTWHDAEHTEWYGDRDGVLLALILGVVSNAAWEGIKWWLAKRKDAQVDISLGYRHDGKIKWIRAKGKSGAVAEVLDKLHPDEGQAG